MNTTKKIGIILANLGTPDPRVVDLPRWKWYPLLKAIILPMRSKRIAQNYQSIWTEQGSPLLAITKQQQAGLQAYLTEQGINAQVEIAMTYGNPSMQSAVKNLLKNDCVATLSAIFQYNNRRINRCVQSCHCART